MGACCSSSTPPLQANEANEATPLIDNDTLQKLPNGWRILKDTNGEKYYQNDISKHTQWECPPELIPYINNNNAYQPLLQPQQNQVPAKSQQQKERNQSTTIMDESLPHRWIKMKDDNDKIYYQNNISKQRQWTQPIANNNINSVVCICGQQLIKFEDGSSLYNGNGCSCDQCFKTAEKNDIVWHCPKETEEALHKFGFGVCNDCVIYNVYDQKRFLKKWNQLFSMGIDDDIVYNAWIHYKFDKDETLQFLEAYNTNMDNILCICNSKLIKFCAKDVYDGKSVMCLICAAKGEEDQIYWHCIKKSRDPVHKYGFEVCDKCVKTKNYEQPVFLGKFAKLMTLGVHEDDVWMAYIRNDQDLDKALQWLLEAMQKQSQDEYEKEMKRVEEEFKDKGWDRKPSILYEEKSKENKPPTPKKRENKLCNGDIKSCNPCKYLSDLLNRYNKLLENNADPTTLCDQYRNSMDAILNNFHHYLAWHDKNDESIDYMHQSLIYKCDMESCNEVKRYYRIREDVDRKTDDNRNYATNDILHQLHCHFNHCYDIGHRLNSEERKKLNQMAPENQEYNEEIDEDSKDDNDDSIDGIIVSQRLKALYSILSAKQSRIRRVRNITTVESTNKFCSNFGQSDTTHLKASENEQLEMKEDIDDNKDIEELKQDNEQNIMINDMDTYVSYSYSFRFWYWKMFYLDDMDGADPNNPEITSRQTYTPPKYKDFKEELLQNEVYTLTKEQYDELSDKAGQRMKCNLAKDLRSKIEENGATQYYEIPNNQPIRLKHLLAIIIYTDMTVFQREFSATFRLNQGETLKDLVLRHSNFHFMARCLREAVEIYGVRKLDQAVRSFYHGVSMEMKFDSFHGNICGVLSTTSSINVSASFAGTKGIIVTMVPNFAMNFFECYWLSQFSHEEELLFIGGKSEMYFMNIQLCDTGDSYKKYVTAIRCINTFNDGYPFDIYANRFMELVVYMFKSDKTGCPQTENLPPLRNKMKKLIKFLIYYELNRYDPERYGKYVENKELNGYIDKVLHHMFMSRKEIILDPELLELTETPSNDVELGSGGYIGYNFLKEIFMKDYNTEKERINFDIIGLLYPQLMGIDILNYNKLTFISINETIEFVAKYRCNVRLNIGENEKDIYSTMTTKTIQMKGELDKAGVEVKRTETEKEFVIVFYSSKS